jgi:hypothetical protein
MRPASLAPPGDRAHCCCRRQSEAAASAALAEAVVVAHRISGTFEQDVPHSRLREFLAEAARIAPAEDPVLAAQLAAAAAWNARPEKATPDARLAAAALAPARRAGDPILVSSGLDAAAEAERAAGRYRQAQAEFGTVPADRPPAPPRRAGRIRDQRLPEYHLGRRGGRPARRPVHGRPGHQRPARRRPAHDALPPGHRSGLARRLRRGARRRRGHVAGMAAGRSAAGLLGAAYAGVLVCGLHDDRAALEESLAGWQRIGSRFERACSLLLLPGRAAQGHAELDALGCPPPAKQPRPARRA